jgi:hypothetical protein
MKTNDFEEINRLNAVIKELQNEIKSYKTQPQNDLLSTRLNNEKIILNLEQQNYNLLEKCSLLEKQLILQNSTQKKSEPDLEIKLTEALEKIKRLENIKPLDLKSPNKIISDINDNNKQQLLLMQKHLPLLEQKLRDAETLIVAQQKKIDFLTAMQENVSKLKEEKFCILF